MMLDFLQAHIWFSATIVGVLFLIVGSFLNMVICCYPAIAKQKKLKFCLFFLKQEKIKIEHLLAEKLNFLYPKSRCSACKKTLHWFYNIPMVSYLLLKGKCVYCRVRLNTSYPVIELLTASTGIIIFLYSGWNIKMLCMSYFTWVLIVISAIDFKTQFIPDTGAFLLLWSGLLINCFSMFATPIQAILGVIAGYGSLYLLNKIFFWIQKNNAIGDGDLKLTAALSAWLGIQFLPLLLLIATVLALVISIMLIIVHKIKWKTMIAFGPFLSLSGWLLLMFNTPLQRWWYCMLGY
jgi:leader peptidase (prepilin peptidase)/N-methyltransferase